MQMFGLPMAGADICGFNGNTDEEMCSRWTQLGSFYPFSRNHNSIHSIPQEPWSFNSSQHIDICRESLEVRYLLIPYFYTLFSEAHMFGAPVWQALSWQFPSDSNTWNIDEQFLVGDSILVSPVLDRGRGPTLFVKTRALTMTRRRVSYCLLPGGTVVLFLLWRCDECHHW